jgi:hypothetical protein
MLHIRSFELARWAPSLSAEQIRSIIKTLEQGDVLYFPKLDFVLTGPQKELLPHLFATKKQNTLYYDSCHATLRGMDPNLGLNDQVVNLLQAYSEYATSLLNTICPRYEASLLRGQTACYLLGESDSELPHIDISPRLQARGKRILTLYTNVHPKGKCSDWMLGEEFSDLIKRFNPTLTPPGLLSARRLLHWLRLRKGVRSDYEHTMLQLQKKIELETSPASTVTSFSFPSGASWLLFGDQRLHAMLSGQAVLAQTFYLPPGGQSVPDSLPQSTRR